jgi:phenylpyruvate tautomerase PptA (4-oxalocrotonate tautomerase family)
MPFLKIQTNQPLDEPMARDLAGRASATVASQLGKPERYVMVSVEHNPVMQFAGSTAPLAYLELKSIGLPATRTTEFSRALCELVTDTTGIDPERIYIEFSDAPRDMWGWNRGTF